MFKSNKSLLKDIQSSRKDFNEIQEKIQQLQAMEKSTLTKIEILEKADNKSEMEINDLKSKLDKYKTLRATLNSLEKDGNHEMAELIKVEDYLLTHNYFGLKKREVIYFKAFVIGLIIVGITIYLIEN